MESCDATSIGLTGHFLAPAHQLAVCSPSSSEQRRAAKFPCPRYQKSSLSSNSNLPSQSHVRISASRTKTCAFQIATSTPRHLATYFHCPLKTEDCASRILFTLQLHQSRPQTGSPVLTRRL